MKTPEHWERAEGLFHAALEHEASERAEFLAQACADTELRAEVESLIAAHEQEGRFIDSPVYEAAAGMLADEVAAEPGAGGRADSWLGRSVGRYSIVAPLGKGAMGEVYLAEDSSLHRKVAIKFLPAEMVSDEQAQKRLVREAQAAAILDHPNICHIHEVGTNEGQSFIVMQYVDGETLASRMKREPLTVEESLAIAVQLADALSEAHLRRIVHRDIKPSNIMITARGQAKLMDFGIAKFVAQRSALETLAEQESTLTEPGALLGTVPYMSPEQARGEVLDSRTDIFSFGVVLYEMVSGGNPFSADSPAGTLSAILSHDPPPLGTGLGVPAELNRIVRKCLEKDREQRYQSAHDLWVDLEKLVRDGSSAIGAVEKPALLQRKNARRFAVVALLATLALGSGIAIYRASRKEGPTTKPITSIAVLPFTNPSGNPDTEYFSVAITEDITNNLSKLSGLKVMARTTVFRYQGTAKDSLTVGRELGVDAVVTGKADQRGDTLTIQAELVRIDDGAELWGDKYHRRSSEVFDVKEQITRQISENLRIKPSSEEEGRLKRRETENTEAYQLYSKGRYQVYQYTDFEKAIDYFNQAIAKDAKYALPHAGLAEAYFHAADVLFAPAKAMPRVKEEALKALTIDPRLSEAHVSMGRYNAYYDWKWSEAESEFNLAIECDPRNATAHHEYAGFLNWRGRQNEADVEMSKALEIEPWSAMINTDKGLMFYWRHQYDVAMGQFLRTIEWAPEFWGAHLYLGMTYDKKLDYASAEAEFTKAKAASGGIATTVAGFGHLYAAQGRKAEAKKVLDQLDEIKKKKGYVSSYYIAIINAGLGENAKAIDWLEKAYDEHSDYMVYLQVEPLLESLREEPRFKALVRRVGLSQ